MEQKMSKKEKPQKDEQMDLIDIQPEKAKEIARVATQYKAAQKARLTALKAEVEKKRQLLELVKEAKLTPLSDGTIKFTVDFTEITVKPRDELIKVKFEKED